MSRSDLTGYPSLRNRNSAFRWAIVAALLALLSLQVSASSHVHDSAQLQHCDVCVQGSHAPLPTKIILPFFIRPILPVVREAITLAPTLAPIRCVIRGPPTTR